MNEAAGRRGRRRDTAVSVAPIQQGGSARPYLATQASVMVFGFLSAGTARAIVRTSGRSNLLGTKDFTVAQLQAGIANTSLAAGP